MTWIVDSPEAPITNRPLASPQNIETMSASMVAEEVAQNILGQMYDQMGFDGPRVPFRFSTRVDDLRRRDD